VLVAPGNMGSAQHAFGAALQAADAVPGKLPSVLLDDPQTSSPTYCTYFTHCLLTVLVIGVLLSIAAPESNCLCANLT
jgi:hypothetical protein